MMTANIYRWSVTDQQYELVATFHDDATVDGISPIASRLRTAVGLIESRDEDPATWVDTITDRLVKHWDSGYFRVTWD